MRGGEVLGGYSSSDMDRDTDRFADREDVAERRDEQGSYGPGAGGERMSGRGGQEESGEEKSPR
ncbi:MAG TPA: hypothetical protein VFW66_11685 [Gemmatimonadales bacterium]|nr:hypothetical protein [Gemmatimonadales bacterium]